MKNLQVALVTGCNGFVGQWLTNYLLAKNYHVLGIDNSLSAKNSLIEYNQIDILDSQRLSGILERTKPSLIFHLAGISYLPDADKSPMRSIEINILGTLSLLEAARMTSISSKILLVGSSKEYDDNLCSIKVSENTAPNPKNFYGITKYSGELLGLQYIRQFGMKIYFTRSFNHSGPGQSPQFVCSDWAYQVAAIDRDDSEAFVSVGDTTPTIDFTDVRDVIDAYWKILEKGTPGEVYNVCSGKGYSLDWILIYLTHKTSKPIVIRQISSKQRGHSTNRCLLGDNSKLKTSTGWECAYSMEKTLDDLYEYWKVQLENNNK